MRVGFVHLGFPVRDANRLGCARLVSQVRNTRPLHRCCVSAAWAGACRKDARPGRCASDLPQRSRQPAAGRDADERPQTASPRRVQRICPHTVGAPGAQAKNRCGWALRRARADGWLRRDGAVEDGRRPHLRAHDRKARRPTPPHVRWPRYRVCAAGWRQGAPRAGCGVRRPWGLLSRRQCPSWYCMLPQCPSDFICCLSRGQRANSLIIRIDSELFNSILIYSALLRRPVASTVRPENAPVRLLCAAFGRILHRCSRHAILSCP